MYQRKWACMCFTSLASKSSSTPNVAFSLAANMTLVNGYMTATTMMKVIHICPLFFHKIDIATLLWRDAHTGRILHHRTISYILFVCLGWIYYHYIVLHNVMCALRALDCCPFCYDRLYLVYIMSTNAVDGTRGVQTCNKSSNALNVLS